MMDRKIKQWFETINIVGIPLNTQELLNAIYSGSFITAAKATFSNSMNMNRHKWAAYVKGNLKRQDFLERALQWIVTELYQDEFVKNKKGIFEYILGEEKHPELLDVRFFEDSVKKAAYNKQTKETKAKGISNCPLCASGNNSNHARIYKLAEMEADHVTPWSKGGKTTLENCEMLCKMH